MVAHHQPHSHANSAPTMWASHAVTEPHLMMLGRKRAFCRCFEKPLGGSRYGWGSSCSGHSRVPFTMRREAQKFPPGRGGEGQSPCVAVSHRCTRAAALRGSRRSCSSR